jgi:hypothetical protein
VHPGRWAQATAAKPKPCAPCVTLQLGVQQSAAVEEQASSSVWAVRGAWSPVSSRLHISS